MADDLAVELELRVAPRVVVPVPVPVLVLVLVLVLALVQYAYPAGTHHPEQADDKWDNFAAIEAIFEGTQNVGCVHKGVSLAVIFDPRIHLVAAKAALSRDR